MVFSSHSRSPVVELKAKRNTHREREKERVEVEMEEHIGRKRESPHYEHREVSQQCVNAVKPPHRYDLSDL